MLLLTTSARALRPAARRLRYRRFHYQSGGKSSPGRRRRPSAASRPARRTPSATRQKTAPGRASSTQRHPRGRAEAARTRGRRPRHCRGHFGHGRRPRGGGRPDDDDGRAEDARRPRRDGRRRRRPQRDGDARRRRLAHEPGDGPQAPRRRDGLTAAVRANFTQAPSARWRGACSA